MLIVDSTSNYDESYSIFNFVWEIICYMWEQTLETNSVKLGNGVIIGPLWVKYGGKIACQPPSAQNPGHAPESSCEDVRSVHLSSSQYINIGYN